MRLALKELLILVMMPVSVMGQHSSYDDALLHLKKEIENVSTFSFKKSVFIVENAFLDGFLDYQEFESNIELLKEMAIAGKRPFPINYSHKDSLKISTYASLFKVFTDTTMIVIMDDVYYHLPFNYDFDDIFGKENWRKMFVSKLLKTNSGNCHSMPYLYKIVCNELGVPCNFALAPNHIYIKHRAEKGGMYNTELTSATFPIDAWLMASGYITLEAIQNGIYMDTLSEKESIALCVIDLAQGYDHKYPGNDGKFVIDCCDLALQHFPDYINAMMLKAETRLRQLQQMQKEMKFAYLKEVTKLPDGKTKWDDMNALYGKMLQLGYRQMPEQMYVEWLTSLKTEKEKYTNKQAPGAAKD